MNSSSGKGFFRRALPFVATFLVAVFVTSLFVDISSPRFGKGFKGRRHQEMKRLRAENEFLKNENIRLKEENEARVSENLDILHDHDLVPPPPPLPVAPKAVK